jgi:hypothetical protein
MLNEMKGDRLNAIPVMKQHVGEGLKDEVGEQTSVR